MTTPEGRRRLTENLLRVVAHLVDLERRPEGGSSWRSSRSRSASSRRPPRPWPTSSARSTPLRAQRLAGLTGLPASEVAGLVRRHLGVVFDICHKSVEFEDITASLADALRRRHSHLQAAGRRGPVGPEVHARRCSALEAFADSIYLSQTTEGRAGETARYLTLGEAIAAWRRDPSGGASGVRTSTCRCSSTTSGSSARRESGIGLRCACMRGTLVGPPRDRDLHLGRAADHLKTGDITDYVSRELEWFRDELGRRSVKVVRSNKMSV